MKREDPRTYARGTGISYAYGAHMHVPWCLYDGSQSMRFYGSLAGHQPIFQMIHENRQFFDGYVLPLWHLALVPYGEHGVSDQASLTRMVSDFSARGVPLVVRLRDEARLYPAAGTQDDVQLAQKDCRRFGPERLAGKENSRHVLGDDYTRYLENGPVCMERGFSENFYAPVARVFAGASRFPLVLHLIRSDSKTADTAGGVFRIAKEWLPAAAVKNVKIASVRWPDTPEASVSWEATPSGDLEIGVSNIAAWAVVRIETDSPVELPHVERATLRATLPESEIPLMRMVRTGGAWQRPAWVDEALAGATDPLAGYHLTRISWSYEKEPWEMDYARKHGLAFHGSCALLHMNMIDSNVSRTVEGIFSAGRDWPGYVRYPGGLPMLIRADFNPPRYGATFVSKDYREQMLAALCQWIDKGAEGVQLDDVFGMLNRVWRYGGDFSPDMLAAVRSYLTQRQYPGVTSATPLDELRDRIVAEMQRVEPVRTNETGFIEVPVNSDKYPGQVWLGSPELVRSGGYLSAELEFFFEGKKPSGIEFSLMDGSRSRYFCRLVLRAGQLYAETADGRSNPGCPGITPDTWIPLRLEFDLETNAFRCAVGPEGIWSGWLPFAMKVPAEQSRLVLNIMVDPREGSFRLRKWDANFQSHADSSVQPARTGKSEKPGFTEPSETQVQMGD